MPTDHALARDVLEKLLEKGVPLSDELVIGCQRGEPWAIAELDRLIREHLTPEEIQEYAEWLGMHSPEDDDLRWIAREALKAPLPEHWKPCKTNDGEIYYFNFATGESVWDHPCDDYYKKLYEEEKGKKARGGSAKHAITSPAYTPSPVLGASTRGATRTPNLESASCSYAERVMGKTWSRIRPTGLRHGRSLSREM